MAEQKVNKNQKETSIHNGHKEQKNLLEEYRSTKEDKVAGHSTGESS